MTSLARLNILKRPQVHAMLRAERPHAVPVEQVDIAAEIATHIEVILDVPPDVYDRRRDLRRLLRVVPDEWLIRSGDMAIDAKIVRALGIEIEAETERHLTGSPFRSASRFELLRKALRVEVEAFNLLCAMRYREI